MRRVLLVILAAMTFFYSGCKSKSEHKKSENSLLIGFSVDNLALERWQREVDVFTATARYLGATVIFKNAENDGGKQESQLYDLLKSDIDILVVLPKEASGLSGVLEEYRKKNIPVISYDRLLMNSYASLYITVDSRKVGEIMATQMMNVTESKNWSCILGPEEDYNVPLILDGINSVISGTDIKINDIFYTQGWSYENSRKYMIDCVRKNKIPETIICGNDLIAQSVIQVLNDSSVRKHIPICGQDADVSACRNIIEGKQDFTVYKPITNLAECAANISVRLGRGETMQDLPYGKEVFNNGLNDVPSVLLDPMLVTKDNMKNVILETGFHSESDIY